MERAWRLQLVDLIVFQSLLSSFLQVVLGGDAQCGVDQYVDPISPQYCKSCLDVCDKRRDPLLEDCKWLCPAYYALKFKTSTSPAPVTRQEPTISADTRSNANTLVLGLIIGSGVAFIFIVTCAGVLIRRHVTKKEKEAARTDQEDPLKPPIQETGEQDVLAEERVVIDV